MKSKQTRELEQMRTGGPGRIIQGEIQGTNEEHLLKLSTRLDAMEARVAALSSVAQQTGHYSHPESSNPNYDDKPQPIDAMAKE